MLVGRQASPFPFFSNQEQEKFLVSWLRGTLASRAVARGPREVMGRTSQNDSVIRGGWQANNLMNEDDDDEQVDEKDGNSTLFLFWKDKKEKKKTWFSPTRKDDKKATCRLIGAGR